MDRFAALKILDFDHLEFAVSDLEKASDFCLRMGFERVGNREILERQLKSRLFVQGGIHILLSHSTLRADPVSHFIAQHGDGVYSVGFRCYDAVTTLDVAANRGAEVVEPPKLYRREFGTVQSAAIRAFGDIRHTFISRQGVLFAEGFDLPVKMQRRTVALHRIDHIAYSIESNQLEEWTAFYEGILGLTKRAVVDEQTESTGRVSRVMQSSANTIQISADQPSPCAKHVQEYLEINHGAGIQHVALTSENILSCLRNLRKEGVRFVASPPATYYEMLMARVPKIDESLADLAELGIQIDGSEHGYLLQTFTQNLMGAFFCEIIQRKGDTGFGERGLRALVEAAKMDQVRRGILN